jgi:hypothetical protein
MRVRDEVDHHLVQLVRIGREPREIRGELETHLDIVELE